MFELLFLTICALLFFGFLFWGFRHLPGERWQTLAVVPHHKLDESWQGTNLTYYGFFLATSQFLAAILTLIMLSSLSIPIQASLLSICLILMFCIPASRIVAMIVEKKRHTFTIGGACFVGYLCAPWCIKLTDLIYTSPGGSLPIIEMLAALATGYALGEGMGRLACISYGCCYGKPLKEYNPLVQKLFRRFSFSFSCPTRKAVYEGKLENEQLLPIQAITAIIYTITALISCWLFLQQAFVAALLIATIVTQGWRYISEIFRADYRGHAKISVYQKMGIILIFYTVAIALIIPGSATVSPNLYHGLISLWRPEIILGLQGLWFLFFLFFGRSTVTSSEVTFSIQHERI